MSEVSGRDYFSIGYDQYFQDDGVHEIPNVSAPENRRDSPCEGCSFNTRCWVDETVCMAARTWQRSGDYRDRDIKRHMREDR